MDSNHQFPRYLNSPCPKSPPKPRMPWKELVAISVGNTLIILGSPLWIPVLLVTLAYLQIKRLLPERKSQVPPEVMAALYKPVDPELRRRMDLGVRDEHGFGLIDPTCLEPDLAWAFSEAKRRAEEEVGGPYKRGDCRRVWKIMKNILKEDFGIVWFTPAEMNPHSRFQ